MNRVREIHSTDINKDIYSHIKNTVPTRLTCTSTRDVQSTAINGQDSAKRSDQTQDLTGVSIRHLAWILTDSSFIQESDLAMSSSGKMAADKKKHRIKDKPPSTSKQPRCTSSQQDHTHVHGQHRHETFPTKS